MVTLCALRASKRSRVALLRCLLAVISDAFARVAALKLGLAELEHAGEFGGRVAGTTDKRESSDQGEAFETACRL